MRPDNRQADATEIEITPKMYRAGANALADCMGEEFDVIIPQVYRAMRSVEGQTIPCRSVPDPTGAVRHGQ